MRHSWIPEYLLKRGGRVKGGTPRILAIAAAFMPPPPSRGTTCTPTQLSCRACTSASSARHESGAGGGGGGRGPAGGALRFRASGAAYGETWPPLFRHHDALNKVEIVIVLEMCRPEEFPMELWDEWPSVES